MIPEPLPPVHPNGNITKKNLHHEQGPPNWGASAAGTSMDSMGGVISGQARAPASCLSSIRPGPGRTKPGRHLQLRPTAASSATGMVLYSWSRWGKPLTHISSWKWMDALSLPSQSHYWGHRNLLGKQLLSQGGFGSSRLPNGCSLNCLLRPPHQ